MPRLDFPKRGILILPPSVNFTIFELLKAFYCFDKTNLSTMNQFTYFLLKTFVFSAILLNSTFSYAQNKANGAKLFELHCASCHNFKQDAIGPQLGGLKGIVDNEYLTGVIKSPKAMMDAKYSRILEKFKKFKTLMPDFNHLQANEIQDIIAFVLEKPAPKTLNPSGKKVLENPISERITQSGIVLNIQKVLQLPYSNTPQLKTRINKMGFHPITKENMVLDLQGKIYILNANNQLDTFFDIKKYFKNFVNKPGFATGLGSFAFHPDFAKNGLFYTSHSDSSNLVKADFTYPDSIPVRFQWVVTEWKSDNPSARVLTGTHRELLRVNVISQVHGMQELVFNPYAKIGDEDYGLLYIGMGDGSSVDQGFPFVPKNKNWALGKLLRIDPLGNNSKNGKYGIPKSNPFVDKDGLDEAFAEGFRNANRISWTKDGKIIVANIGERHIESLYLLKAGKHYGWPYREGTFLLDTLSVNMLYALPKNEKNTNFAYPVAQFDHDEGNAIMGGFEYTGSQIPQLQGKYIFGEIQRGRIFYVHIKDLKEGSQAKIYECPLSMDGQITSLWKILKDSRVDLRIGQDAFGEIYLFSKVDGMMYKIVK